MAAQQLPGENPALGGMVMLKLPNLPYNIQQNQSALVEMRGINFSDQISDGDMAWSRNISSRRWPYISTRRKREQQSKSGGAAYSGVTALYAWDKLIAVEGTKLLFDGVEVATVSAGEKQFAVVNTKLVVWPDKICVDVNSRSVTQMAASLSVAKLQFTASTITATAAVWGSTTPDQVFKAGDTIKISGASKAANNGHFTITEISATTITIAGTLTAVSSDSNTVTLSRDIPDLDFICESGNRLWGCCSADQTLYASALGDPTNFYTFMGLSTDSYSLGVGSEGAFTGCCKLTSSVLFWKETTLHKMLGDYPAEYSLATYNIEGLQEGCHKSLQVINEMLYYMGLHGVYAYSGGTPALISPNFGEHEFTEAVGGNDGDSYYLSVKEGGQNYLFVYETQQGLWVMEDTIRCKAFTRIGKELYFADDGGSVWLADSGTDDPDIDWEVQLTPFYETIQGRKSYSKLLLRLELPKGSILNAEIRSDGGKWQHVGKIVGSECNVQNLRLAVGRCDKFELRLKGHGPCTILSLLRQFSVGSDV